MPRTIPLLLVFASAALAQHPETGYIEMPAPTDDSYRLGSGVGTGRHWGKPETIAYLLLVAREWRERHGDEMVLSIGDISKPDGSSFPPHKTHMDGCCIDVVTRGPNITRIEWEDQEKTLELARLFVQYGATRIYYNHPYVIERVPEVRALEKHNDHFHVIVDPERVPEGEGPFLIEAMKPALGIADVADAGGLVVGPEFRWNYLAAKKGWQKAWRVQLDADLDHAAVDHDSGWVRSGATSGRIEAVLRDGETWRYKIEVEGPAGERLELPWRDVRADFRPPVATGVRPEEGAEVPGNPTFEWSVAGKGDEPVAWRVEVDEDASHARAGLVGERTAGKATSHTLRVALRPGRTYWWRVVVEDAAGNEGESEWRSFRTSRDYRGGRTGKVKAADGLNFRTGPGTNFPSAGQLDRGEVVEILEEKSSWLRVRYTRGGRAWVGWVHADYIEE